MAKKKFRFKKEWSGEYKGIRFTISNWELGDKPAWNFYLHLALEQFPKEVRDSLKPKRYFTQFGTLLETNHDNLLHNLEWHSGMTYLSKKWNEDSVFHVIKAGCDYQHYWDQGKEDFYSEDYLYGDVEVCVDSLLLQFPKLKSMKSLWANHRAKFPGNNTEHRWFNEKGKEIESPY